MEHIQTKVYKYLIYLQKYLEADLVKFKMLCDDAEKEENQKNSEENSKIVTTMSPYSFDFHHGKPVIARSTIPHSLSLLATIDVLGFLIRKGVEYCPDTSKNFDAFFKKSNKNVSEKEIIVLREVYRNGMSHAYFPKLGMEISCHSANPKGKLFFKRGDGKGQIVLNVNQLMIIVIEKLNNIITDASLYSLLEEKYEKLVNLYDRKYQLAIWDLKKELK